LKNSGFIIILIFLSAGVFFPSLTGGFLWDDEFLITHNPAIKSLKNIPQAFTRDFFYEAFETEQITFYRPIVIIFNTLQYALFGLRPFWWRLTNLLLHAANIMLCYFFFTRVLRIRPYNAFLSLMVIAVHPIASESVCFISGRTDLLALLFLMTALLLYFNERRSIYSGIGSLCLFTIGLFTKELIIVFPAVIIAVDYMLSDSLNLRAWISTRLAYVLKRLLPYFIISLAFLIIRFFFVKGIRMPSYPTGSLRTTWLNVPQVALRYIALAILPLKQNCDYTNGIKIIASFVSALFILPAIIEVFFCFFAFRFFIKKTRFSLGIIWFILFLLPVLNIFPLGIWMAERFLYIPLIGAAIALAFVFECLPPVQAPWRNAAYIFLLIFIPLSLMRARIWGDELNLWQDAVHKNPANPQARIIYGQVLFSKGRLDEALTELNAADISGSINLDFQRAQTFARIYTAKRDFEKAEEAFNIAEALIPSSLMNIILRGRLLLAQGRPDEAERFFRRVIHLNPRHLGAVAGMMEILSQRKEASAELLQFAELGISLNPDYGMSYFYKGLALERMGRIQDAERAWRDAIRIAPNASEPYLFLAELFESHMEKNPSLVADAATVYVELLKRHPDNIDALNNYGIVCIQLGNLKKARELWERALTLSPTDPIARANLERLNNQEFEGRTP